jgi:hypothetical protein
MRPGAATTRIAIRCAVEVTVTVPPGDTPRGARPILIAPFAQIGVADSVTLADIRLEAPLVQPVARLPAEAVQSDLAIAAGILQEELQMLVAQAVTDTHAAFVPRVIFRMLVLEVALLFPVDTIRVRRGSVATRGVLQAHTILVQQRLPSAIVSLFPVDTIRVRRGSVATQPVLQADSTALQEGLLSTIAVVHKVDIMCPAQDHAAKRQLLLVITPPVPATLRTMRAPPASSKAPQRSKVAMNAPAAFIHHLTAAVVVLV